MAQQSIRFRLTLWYSLALGAGLSLFAFATWFLLWHSLTNDVDRDLVAHVDSLGVFISAEIGDRGSHIGEEIEEYASALPVGTHLRVLDPGRNVVFSSTERFPWEGLFRADNGIRRIRSGGHAYHVITGNALVNGNVWRIALASNVDELEKVLDRLRLLLLILLPAVGLVAIVGGHWLSRRALKPVDDITRAASCVSIRNLSTRLVVPGTNDELQRLSETFNSMLARIETAVRRLSRFTADASHELRTPLAVIRTTAEIANRKSRTEVEYGVALGRIVAESERMTGILEDLLFLAHGDSEVADIHLSAVDVVELVREVQAEMHGVASARSVRIFIDGLPAQAQALGNAAALRRLLTILLDNAIKYSRQGGDVLVRIRENVGGFVLEVEDHGVGITPGDLPYIFDRFYRSSYARDHGIPGSGLGLALAASIAQQHRTRISVDSVLGSGSCFSVLLPACESGQSQMLVDGDRGVRTDLSGWEPLSL